MFNVKTLLTASLALLALQTQFVIAQEYPEMPKPTKQHQWLGQFVGKWESTTKGIMGPDQPAMECTGSMISKPLGEFWIVNDLRGDMMGTEIHGIQTLGYDAAKEKFVGTWVDSSNDLMWQYVGTLDESGKKLTLEAEGPNFTQPDKKTMFRDAYEFKSADLIIATSSMQGEDGKWVTFMTGEMKRVK